MIEATSKEEIFITRGMDFIRGEIMKGDNEMLKTTISYSKGVNDTGREGDSISKREEDAITEITSVDRLDVMPRDDRERSEREIPNPGRIDDEGMICKRAHQRPLGDIIDKRERRKVELERTEGDMRKRLDMLECSMPAVMILNSILKTSRKGAPVCTARRVLEKQFQDAKELTCRSSPSCHYDRRVREVEAERKLALKKTEEARALWSEKLAMLEARRAKLEEARRIQEERRRAMERLNEEAKALREATKIDEESCRGECGKVPCEEKWLAKIASVTSVKSEDVRCLEKLERLAEDELTMKRGIAELERREEAYMRTLSRADELWSRIEDDENDASGALKGQLDVKIAANQQLADRVCELEDALERSRARLIACRAELEKFLSVERIEATIGRDDDVAEVTDKAVAVRARIVHRPVGRVDDVATVKDGEALARVRVADGETSARIITTDAVAEVASLSGVDKYVTVRPDVVDRAVDRPEDLVQVEDAESAIRPEDFAYEERRLKKVREYLSKLGSLEELYEDGLACSSDFPCNDVVTSPTGMTDEELIALGVDPSSRPRPDVEPIGRDEKRERPFREESGREEIAMKLEKVEAKEPIATTSVREIPTRRAIQEEVTDDKSLTKADDVKTSKVKGTENDQAIVVQRDTILSWIDMIDTIRMSAAKHPDCHTVKKDADALVERIGAHVGIKPKKVEEENVIIIAEDELKKIIEKNGRKVKEEAIIETKLQDELIVPKERTIEPSKNESIPSISPPRPEETSVEVKASIEPAAELLPTLTKEEISVGIEPPAAVSIENSFQSSTIPVKEDLKSVAVPATKPAPYKIEIEETEIGEEKHKVKEIVYDTKDDKIPQTNKIKKDATLEDSTDKELKIDTSKKIINSTDKKSNDKIINSIDKKNNDEKMNSIDKEKNDDEKMNSIDKEKNDIAINSTDKEETLIVPKTEEEKEEEIVPERIKRNEIKMKDVTIKDGITEKEEMVAEKVSVDERSPVSEEIDEGKRVEDAMEKLKETPQINEVKVAGLEETRDAAIVETKISEVPPVKITEAEQDVGEALPGIVGVKEIAKITPERISPTVDLTEIEEIEPKELPIVDVEEVSIPDVINKKIPVEESPPSVSAKEEFISSAITEEKLEIEEPSMAYAAQKEIEIEEMPIMDAEKEKIEEMPIMDAEKEKIEEKEPIAEITEKKVEISPVTEQIMLKEVEEIEELVTTRQPEPEAEIKKEKDEVIRETPEEVTPPIELFEEREREEIPRAEEEISAKIALSAKLAVEDEREKEPAVEEKKPELDRMELKIPIVEVKPDEVQVPVIPIDSRLLMLQKIKEKELLQIAPPIKLPCKECCLQSPAADAGRPMITRTSVVQTGIARTEVALDRVEVAETKIVEIATQTILAVEPPRVPSMRIMGEYPRSIASSAEIIDGRRPEITRLRNPTTLGQKRLRDQSTVTTASTGSQTDETDRVSHDRVARDERERRARAATDELLRSIKIAAGLARPDPEREIRTINYGGRSDEMTKAGCNCCQCGGISSTAPSTRPRSRIRPQIDGKTPTLPATLAADAFKRIFIPKIDRPILHDRLCPDCKTKIQERMSREKYEVARISRDRGSCGCAPPSIDKSYRAVPRKREIEKKDQACLAKIPKRKTEQKGKDDSRLILESSEKFVEPLSPSCICYQLEKPSAGPTRKGNCYCED